MIYLKICWQWFRTFAVNKTQSVLCLQQITNSLCLTETLELGFVKFESLHSFPLSFAKKEHVKMNDF